jgi:hypothetical protein
MKLKRKGKYRSRRLELNISSIRNSQQYIRRRQQNTRCTSGTGEIVYGFNKNTAKQRSYS